MRVLANCNCDNSISLGPVKGQAHNTSMLSDRPGSKPRSREQLHPPTHTQTHDASLHRWKGEFDLDLPPAKALLH